MNFITRLPLRFVFLDALWLCLLSAYILAGLSQVPFHGDESAHIFMTRDYVYQFIDRDLTRIHYSETPIDTLAITEQEFRLLNGTVHKYLAGFFWHLRGYSAADLNRVWWTWGADINYNRDNGAIPSDDLLVTTRLASALLMCVGMVALFAIGRHLDGRITAYAASAFYALNPALLLNGRRSMLEGSLMAFSLLTVLAAIAFVRAAREKRGRWRWALVLGLAVGMTVASKHTGLFTVLPLVAGCGLWLAFQAWRGRENAGVLRDFVANAAALVTAGVLSLIVFYALNPAWWGDPVGRLRPVLDLRNKLLAEQTAAFGTYPSLPESVVGFVRQVIVGVPQYYEAPDWVNYIADQIATYERTPWTGVWLGASLPGLVVITVLLLGGVWRLLRTTSEHIGAGGRWIAIFWVVGTILLTVVLTPLEWQRYYLPAVLPITFLCGLGVTQMVVIGTRLFNVKPAARLQAGSEQNGY